MSRKLRIQALIYSLLFSAAAMAVMLYYSANRMIVIADVARDSVNSSYEEDNADKAENDFAKEDKSELRMQDDGENTNYLCIPLPEGFKAEQVKIEKYYMNKQIKVFLQDAPGKFYDTNAISGNFEYVEGGDVEYTKEGAWLCFDLTDIYESRSILENNYLYVEFVHPREIYDKIVVIDVGHGGDDTGSTLEAISEKDIAIDIAKRLKEKLDETDIKVYYTRMDDSNPDDEDRIYLANAVGADMFISIHTAFDENDSQIYGTSALYNSSFFMPGFGSVELADLIEREVVTGISGKGLGLFAADEECYILRNASIPATILQVGYLSNNQEAILLQKENYRQRIADGIYSGIIKAFEK